MMRPASARQPDTVMTDCARSVVVMAKTPTPGQAKTRLHDGFSPDEAAALASAALSDTLRAVREAPVRRILGWEGDRGSCPGDFLVIDQGCGGLAQRLAGVLTGVLTRYHGQPVLLIAMDTPQVTPELLTTSWEGADAVLGLTEDGGFWALGLRSCPAEPVLAGIPMSTDRTGAAQLERLLDLGYSVKGLPPLRDVDTPEDAARIAEDHPGLGFSTCYRQIRQGS